MQDRPARTELDGPWPKRTSATSRYALLRRPRRRAPVSPTRRNATAFTLIELLVVVAIIALLIAMVLPSLRGAQHTGRLTLCLSRISQLGKAMMLYAADYAETPPFVGMPRAMAHPGNETIGGPQDPNEDWLVRLPGTWSADERRNLFYQAEQRDWPAELKLPRSGTLFVYARFEALYRCPEFDRIRHDQKTQSAFNYARTEWGRMYRWPGRPGQPGWPGYPEEGGYVDDTLGPQGDWAGPIVRLSEPHSPGHLAMLVDEQWDRHVARPPEMFGDVPYFETWVDGDPLFCRQDELGQYHGGPVVESRYYDPALPIKRAGMSFYDGHAELLRDPAPSRDPAMRDVYSDTANNTNKIYGMYRYIFEVIFAQRGRRPPVPLEDPPWVE